MLQGICSIILNISVGLYELSPNSAKLIISCLSLLVERLELSEISQSLKHFCGAFCNFSSLESNRLLLKNFGADVVLLNLSKAHGSLPHLTQTLKSFKE